MAGRDVGAGLDVFTGLDVVAGLFIGRFAGMVLGRDDGTDGRYVGVDGRVFGLAVGVGRFTAFVGTREFTLGRFMLFGRLYPLGGRGPIGGLP